MRGVCDYHVVGRSAAVNRLVQEFHLEGFCLLNKGLTAAQVLLLCVAAFTELLHRIQVAECAAISDATYNHNIRTVNVLGMPLL